MSIVRQRHTVLPRHSAVLEGRTIHPVLGTVTLVQWMEEAGRRMLLPFLGPDQEGLGVEVRLSHRRAVPVGASIEAEAVLVEKTDSRLLCDFRAYHGGELVAEGRFVQRILSRTQLPYADKGVTMPVAETTYEHILTRIEGRVGVIQLNRPKALNALSPELMEEVSAALHGFDADTRVGAIVLTGNERAFAAGADIKDMVDASVSEMIRRDFLATWDGIRGIKKPIIAGVSGFVLGGGCELMMMCDMVVASESASIGQPEINLGVIPGAGGTQRLTRIVGKARAMEMVLCGRPISASEALDYGLVNKVVPVEVYLEETLRLAAEVASKAPIAVRLGKQAINAAYETSLTEGLAHERQNFYMLFGTEDQKEGMRAFVEKRTPEWKGC